MRSILRTFFINNWQRKTIAILLALTIWVLINNSITITRTFSNVQLRIVNLPFDKTVEGLLPDGVMDTPISITITGRKQVMEMLTSNDLEVVVDARGQSETWIVHITKQMIVCTNPLIDLSRNISDVEQGEFILHLSPLVTEKIPVTITAPIGEPPQGYQYLDIWPQNLYHTVSGPKEVVEHLKQSGLEITFDLSKISEKELAALAEREFSVSNDEISYYVPASWKKVSIPFLNYQLQEINDPLSAQLRIGLLHKELLPITAPIPLYVYYPLPFSEILNPSNTTLAKEDSIKSQNGISVIASPLFAKNVSRMFLDIVRDNLLIAITALPQKNLLDWSVLFIDPKKLESTYVAAVRNLSKQPQDDNLNFNEAYLRARFQNYMRKLELYSGSDVKLKLLIQLQGSQIFLQSNL